MITVIVKRVDTNVKAVRRFIVDLVVDYKGNTVFERVECVYVEDVDTRENPREQRDARLLSLDTAHSVHVNKRRFLREIYDPLKLHLHNLDIPFHIEYTFLSPSDNVDIRNNSTFDDGHISEYHISKDMVHDNHKWHKPCYTFSNELKYCFIHSLFKELMDPSLKKTLNFLILLACLVVIFYRSPKPKKKECTEFTTKTQCTDSSEFCRCIWCNDTECLSSGPYLYIPETCLQTRECDKRIEVNILLIVTGTFPIISITVAILLAIYMCYRDNQLLPKGYRIFPISIMIVCIFTAIRMFYLVLSD